MHLCAEAEHKHVGNILCVVHFLELFLQLGLKEQACTDSVRTQTVRYQSTSPQAGHTYQAMNSHAGQDARIVSFARCACLGATAARQEQ